MKISAIVTSYNHSNFIGAAIESVLSQSRLPDEIIVIDDGSTDSSRDVIANYNVKKIFLDKNLGAAEAFNTAITASSGEFIALLNSDDIWHPEKLRVQEDYLMANPGVAAVFSEAGYIDERGGPIPSREYSKNDVFAKHFSSRCEYIRQFFFEGNCICHPSMVIRKSVYDRVGLYDNSLRQLPDFEMWIRVIKNFSIAVLDEKLISFRVLENEKNTSSRSYENTSRLLFEHFILAKRFFQGISNSFFMEAFSEDFNFKGQITHEHVEIEKALIYFKLDEKSPLLSIYRLVGIELLLGLYSDSKYREILLCDYGIDHNYVHSQSGSMDIFLRDNFLRSRGVKSQLANGLLRGLISW